MHLVPPEPKPEPRKYSRARSPRPEGMLQCPRCDGREVIVTIIGAVLVGRKLKGGTQEYLCAVCHRAGQRVVLG